ncbi:hypothetical protein RhiirB3_435739 [Rhizophagus irregularis]|nr:hypothetical protein RhiirB3_435739 [Rhizophagus irregularis]
MTLPNLPYDCIYYILNQFQNDRSTLLNCLLVNRSWCEITVPLLYANPFIRMAENSYSIILTLISCFDKEELLLLKNQLKLNNINFNFINNINIKYNKPLFEYPKYLKIFDFSTMNLIIIKWFESYSKLSFTQRDNLSKNILPLIYQIILKKCTNIKHFYITISDIKFLNIKNLTPNLSNLDSLTLQFHDTNMTKELLIDMENICLNLKRLEISISYYIQNNSYIFKKLCKVIQKQKNLKDFKLSCDNTLLNNILISLEFQKYSLVYIEFEHINFKNISLKNFISLHNLKYLKFHYCCGLLLDEIDILTFASFKLEELILSCNDWNHNITASIIKYLGESLQSLLLFSENLTISIMKNLSIYCLNLNTLDIETKYLTFPDLFTNYFKNLRIRILHIKFNYHYELRDLLFTNLAINLPINLKEITIRSRRYKYFKKFLENCHNNNLEIIHFNCNIDLEFLETILNFIERTNSKLKLLSIFNIDNCFKNNKKSSELLDQIKAKGVKIVDFGSIYKFEVKFVT